MWEAVRPALLVQLAYKALLVRRVVQELREQRAFREQLILREAQNQGIAPALAAQRLAEVPLLGHLELGRLAALVSVPESDFQPVRIFLVLQLILPGWRTPYLLPLGLALPELLAYLLHFPPVRHLDLPILVLVLHLALPLPRLDPQLVNRRPLVNYRPLAPLLVTVVVLVVLEEALKLLQAPAA